MKRSIKLCKGEKGPGQCAQLLGVSSGTPKSHEFDSSQCTYAGCEFNLGQGE